MKQYRDVKEIEQTLKNIFSNVCYWFADNKLTIHFGEDKAKRIMFDTKKHPLNKDSTLDIKYGEIHIGQYHTVTYLGCTLDEGLSVESIALNIIKKVNIRLRFLYREKRFLF